MENLMTSQQFPDLLRIGLRKVWLNEYQQQPEFYSKIFKVESSSKPYEEELVMAGFSAVPEWDADGQELPTDRILTGNRVLFVHKDYGMMWSVSKRLLREDMYAKVGRDLIQEAVKALKQTIEQVAHGFIINGFTNYAPAGNRTLFSTTQQLIGGGTFSNRLNVALDGTGLQQALTRFRRWVNHRGHPVVMEPKILLVPPELEWAAKTLLQSSTYPHITVNANGTITPASGGYDGLTNVLRSAVDTLIIDPYLTDPNDWFMFAAPNNTKLRFFWREKPQTDMETDFRTKGVLHSITAAFSCGWVDFSGCLGSQVS